MHKWVLEIIDVYGQKTHVHNVNRLFLKNRCLKMFSNSKYKSNVFDLTTLTKSFLNESLLDPTLP